MAGAINMNAEKQEISDYLENQLNMCDSDREVLISKLKKDQSAWVNYLNTARSAAAPQPKVTAVPVAIEPLAASRTIPAKKERCKGVTCRQCKNFAKEGHCTWGGWMVTSPDRVRDCEQYE